MTYPCTCCQPARQMTCESVAHEWQHVDDQTFAEVFHVHRDHVSVDCDGPLDQFSVSRPADLRPNPDGTRPNGEDLWRIEVRSLVYCQAIEGTLHVRYGDGPKGEWRAVWSERTDEGGRSCEIRGCTDPECAFTPSSQRDHFAEAAGY